MKIVQYTCTHFYTCVQLYSSYGCKFCMSKIPAIFLKQAQRGIKLWLNSTNAQNGVTVVIKISVSSIKAWSLPSCLKLAEERLRGLVVKQLNRQLDFQTVLNSVTADEPTSHT